MITRRAPIGNPAADIVHCQQWVDTGPMGGLESGHTHGLANHSSLTTIEEQQEKSSVPSAQIHHLWRTNLSSTCTAQILSTRIIRCVVLLDGLSCTVSRLARQPRSISALFAGQF
jgi:hypothetical protein